MLKKWDDLPDFMRIPEVRPYWEILNRKRLGLMIKRVFDFCLALVLLIILAIPMIIIAILIRCDSEGAAIFRQDRVTTCGKRFRIHKYRTMVQNAENTGAAVTVSGDMRITRIGKKLRHLRIDEWPQLIDVLEGTMSFVGTRPEATRFVEKYKPEYYATLLMPAGITSEASIRYKDEDQLLRNAEDVNQVYLEQVLPAKMQWNLESIRRFRFLRDVLTMIRTVLAVCGKDYT